MSNHANAPAPIQSPEGYFPEDYRASRQRFHELCQEEGHRLESFEHPERGPHDEPLAMDAAWCGAERGTGAQKARRLLIFSSGLHGLEGPLGAACQLAALDQRCLGQFARANGWDVLLIHAMNPYGVAHHRRWDHENIDVNRNFWLDESEIAGASPVYEELSPWLNPNRIDWHDRLSFYFRAVATIRKHGYAPVKQAIAEGQTQQPNGLFYTGTAPSWTREVIERTLPGWVEPYEFVAHIDVHSGLGRWGECKLLLDYQVRDEQRKWMQGHPPESWEQASPDGAAYNATGGLGRWCNHQFQRQNYLYLCAEVGTYGPMKVLRMLRHENQQWHCRPQREASVVSRLREMFCPRSTRWRRAAVQAVWTAIVRTMGAG